MNSSEYVDVDGTEVHRELQNCGGLLCKHRIHRMGTDYTETAELPLICLLTAQLRLSVVAV